VEKVDPLWSAFHAWADQSVLLHPSIQKCPDEFQQPLVLDSFCDLTHQFVVIDSIEKFLQIEINHPAVARGNVLLCLGHCLMRGSSRSKTVAVVGERRVPLPLQNLHHRLLDQTIQHRWDTKLSHPSVRLGDFHPPHRFRLVGPTQCCLFTFIKEVGGAPAGRGRPSDAGGGAH
jgi:site-specific DNA recombinase